MEFSTTKKDSNIDLECTSVRDPSSEFSATVSCSHNPLGQNVEHIALT